MKFRATFRDKLSHEAHPTISGLFKSRQKIGERKSAFILIALVAYVHEVDPAPTVATFWSHVIWRRSATALPHGLAAVRAWASPIFQSLSSNPAHFQIVSVLRMFRPSSKVDHFQQHVRVTWLVERAETREIFPAQRSDENRTAKRHKRMTRVHFR